MTRRAALNAVLAGGAGTVVGAGAYGLAYSRHQLEVVRATIAFADLPPALDGLRIGLITDLHHSQMVPLKDVVRATDLMMAERPDVIILGGDYVTDADRRYMVPCAEGLARLTAPAGVYAVLGNHDDDRDMPAALVSQGFVVLKDARTTVVARGEKFELAGLRFWTQRQREIARVLKGSAGPVLLIAHDPRRLREAAALGTSVVLSGHTHGGQVNLPLIGPIAARKFPVVAGIGGRGNTTIFVSRGVGTVYVPYRFRCPPDVAVLTLRPTKVLASHHPAAL